VKYAVRPQAYLRYGDDFIIISKNIEHLKLCRGKVAGFVYEKLKLEINKKNDIIVKAKRGLKFLGVWIFPFGRRLNKRNWSRARVLLNNANIASYSGLVKQHSKQKRIKEFNWVIIEKLINTF